MDSNFFKQLFTSLNSEDSWTILGMLLISFLIGLITNYFLNRRRVRDLEKELGKREREQDHLRAQLTDLQGKYDLQGADLKKASLELVDKSKSLETVEAEKRTLNSRLNATLIDLDKSREEFQENTSRIEDLNDQILGIRTKNAQLSTELEEKTALNTQYALTQQDATANPETEVKLTSLLAENASLKNSIDELKTKGIPDGTAASALRVTQLETENEQLKLAISDFESKTEATTDDYKSSEAYLALEAKVAELETEREQLKTTINSTPVNSLVSSGGFESSTAYTELQAKISELETEKEQLNISLNTYKEQEETTVDGYESSEAYTNMEARLAELEAENEKLEDSLSEIIQLESGNEALNNSVRTLLEENEDLKEQLNELPQYEAGNEVLNNSMNTLLNENANLQEQSDSLTQYENGNQILSSSMSDLIAKNLELEEKLNQTTTNRVEWAVGENGVEETVEIEDVTSAEAQVKFRAAIGTQIAMASKEERDDLKQISGVGPFIEEKLNDLGIYTFEQISQLDEGLIETLTTAIEFFPGRIERDEWVGQADRLYYTKGSTPQEMASEAKIITRRYATATEKIIVQPRTAPKPASATTARIRTERDDLKKIEGVGPKISEILNKNGILTFAGLSATPVDRLKRILAEAGNRYKMHNPATWPEQAKLAAEGQWEKLKELQDYLDGGRDKGKRKG